jgi:hypothetical protein
VNVGNSPARMHRRRWYLNATHLSTMSRTQTPPGALTQSAHLRPVAGATRAIPRRIHGVRPAISFAARSERRIAMRAPGVGVDTNSASADPARAPWRSTASRRTLNRVNQSYRRTTGVLVTRAVFHAGSSHTLSNRSVRKLCCLLISAVPQQISIKVLTSLYIYMYYLLIMGPSRGLFFY